MPRENPHSHRDHPSQAKPREDRAGDDQRELPAAKPPAAAGSTSLDTSFPAAQSPAERQVSWPEESYSFETNQGPSNSADAACNDIRENPMSQQAAGCNRGKQTDDLQQDAPDDDSEQYEAPSKDSEYSQPDWRSSRPSVLGMTWKTLLIVAGISLLCGAAGAWATNQFAWPGKLESDQKSAKKGGKSGQQSGDGGKSAEQVGKSNQQGDKSTKSAAASALSIPGFTAADDAETLKKQIEDLANRLNQVDHRLDSLEKPEHETPPAVHTLQTKVGELTAELDQVARLPSRFRSLEKRLSSIEQRIKTLPDEADMTSELKGNRQAAPGLSSAVRPAAGDQPPGASQDDERDSDSEARAEAGEIEAGDDGDATMDLGIELFRQGRYAQAREVFRRLQAERPHDARVWYYSALANGLITHAWDGRTQRLFEQGVQRERAQTPPGEQIDAAFQDLQPEEAKTRLGKYRREAQKAADNRGEPEPAIQYRLTPGALKVP